MGLLVAGTKYRGEFEERLKKLMEEIKQSDEIILFIDEVHTLIGAGAAEGAIDAANILKPALARGELQVPQHTKRNERCFYFGALLICLQLAVSEVARYLHITSTHIKSVKF